MITLCQWAELCPTGSRALLRELTNHSLHQEDGRATQHGEDTVGQQEGTCTDTNTRLLLEAVHTSSYQKSLKVG